jgi:hypothetical protein
MNDSQGGEACRNANAVLLVAMAVALLGGCGGGDAPEVVTCAFAGPAPAVLSWDAVPGADGYRLYFRTAPGSYVQNLGQGLDIGNVLSFTIANIAGGTTYHFAVTAYDSSGESDFSNEACKSIQ